MSNALEKSSDMRMTYDSVDSILITVFTYDSWLYMAQACAHLCHHRHHLLLLVEMMNLVVVNRVNCGCVTVEQEDTEVVQGWP